MMTSVVFRIPTVVHLTLVCCALCVRTENVEIVTPENTKLTVPVTEAAKNVTPLPVANDSYVRAYAEVQKLRQGPKKRNDYYEGPKQSDYNTVIRSTYLADDAYPPLTHHWPPPHAPPTYGPPHDHCHSTPYSSPPGGDLFGLLPKKLSLKLVAKLLLKLLLFKIMVKFLAVICLLLFVPLLKAKGASEEHAEDRRRGRQMDALASLVWSSIEGKDSLYGEDGEMKDVGDIAEQLDDDDEEEDNFFAGPLKAVRFLEFCVSTVDRVVGFILGILTRQTNEGQDLSSFVLDKMQNFVNNL